MTYNDQITADVFLTALTVWREARGESREGQIAVAWSIRNRAARGDNRYPKTVLGVVTQKWAYSSLTDPKDPQLAKWPGVDDPGWMDILQMANDVWYGEEVDPTDGATMYYSDTIPFPASWDPDQLIATVKIGHHQFYREK